MKFIIFEVLNKLRFGRERIKAGQGEEDVHEKVAVTSNMMLTCMYN